MRKGLWCAGAALRSALRWMRERLRPFMWHQSPSSTEVSAATQSRCHLDLLVAGWLNTCRIDLDSDALTLTDLSSQSTYTQVRANHTHRNPKYVSGGKLRPECHNSH